MGRKARSLLNAQPKVIVRVVDAQRRQRRRCGNHGRSSCWFRLWGHDDRSGSFLLWLIQIQRSVFVSDFFWLVIWPRRKHDEFGATGTRLGAWLPCDSLSAWLSNGALFRQYAVFQQRIDVVEARDQMHALDAFSREPVVNRLGNLGENFN